MCPSLAATKHTRPPLKNVPFSEPKADNAAATDMIQPQLPNTLFLWKRNEIITRAATFKSHLLQGEVFNRLLVISKPSQTFRLPFLVNCVRVSFIKYSNSEIIKMSHQIKVELHQFDTSKSVYRCQKVLLQEVV